MVNVTEKTGLLDKTNKQKIEKHPQEDYDPYTHRELDHPTSDLETFIHFLKACIGTGILAMPEAFKFAGMINGIISTALIGCIVTYCLHLLVKSQYILCKRLKVGLIPYPESMQAAVEMGPECLKFFSKFAQNTTIFFLCCYQLGILCIYVIFVASNVKIMTDYYVGINIEITHYILMLVTPFCLIICIPNLKYLVPVSFLADVLSFVSCGIIFYYLCQHLHPLKHLKMFGTAYQYPLFVGTTMFALQSPAVITALENNMKTPQHFRTPCGILNVSMVTVTALYIIVAVLGYWRYGEDIKPSITLNLPTVDGVGQAVRILYSIAIFSSFGMNGLVLVQIIWRYYVENKVKDKRTSNVWNYGLRLISVSVACLIASTIPYLGLIISLLGTFCLSILGIAFPALMDICVSWPHELGYRKWVLWKNIVLIILAILGLIFGSYSSMSEIITDLKKGCTRKI